MANVNSSIPPPKNEEAIYKRKNVLPVKKKKKNRINFNSSEQNKHLKQ